ncbi:Dickkopf N-terminal cysteine-rich domain-containing protein [Myxococcaceae bacterium GXIMD 01537]
MKRMMMALFLVMAVGCSVSVEGPPVVIDPNNNGGTDGGTNGGGDKLPEGLCNAKNRCPDGQFCFNGICALGCTNNSNCASDQYCDTGDGVPSFCKNKTVPTCTADTQCAASQVCFKGFCSLKPPEVKPTCDPAKAGSAEDGCDKYAVCNDPDQNNNTTRDAYCASFPPCPESGVCPTGLAGALCNDGYLTGKGRFCMEGMCKENSNCPSSWNCVRPFANSVVGFCSPGSIGTPCATNSHCLSGNCMAPPGTGMAGVCM